MPPRRPFPHLRQRKASLLRCYTAAEMERPASGSVRCALLTETGPGVTVLPSGNDMTSSMAVAIAAITAALILGVMLIVSWFSNRTEIKAYTRFGLYVALVVAATYTVGALGAWFELGETHPGWLAGELTFNFFWIVVAVATGIMFSLEKGSNPFPLIGRRLVEPAAPPAQSLPSLAAPATGWRAIAVPVVLLVLGSLVYSALVFSVFEWERGTGRYSAAGIDIELLNPWSPSLMLILATVSIVEELTFRLAIQNQLAHLFGWDDRKYWRTIVLTTLLWTLLHAGAVDPDWVKFLQVFPLGLALGWMFRRYGIESCMAAHVLLNVLASFLPV